MRPVPFDGALDRLEGEVALAWRAVALAHDPGDVERASRVIVSCMDHILVLAEQIKARAGQQP